MLAHGVVVEAKHLGQFGDVHRPRGLHDIDEDLVPSWVTQGTRLPLNRGRRRFGGCSIRYPTSLAGRQDRAPGGRRVPIARAGAAAQH
jgi:hypothetical protein